MPKQSYETSALLNNARVKTSRLEDYKIVDNAVTPEIYTLILTDEAIIPDKLAVTLIDGDSMETKVGNGKVWSECLSLGESGEMPTTVSWNDISGKPTTFAPTIGTTSTTAKAGNYQPTWDQVTSKPAVIAAGATQAAARTVIGAGTSDYVLPTGGTNTTFLRGDGTWVIPTNTTYTVITQPNIENITSNAGSLISGLRSYQAFVSYVKGGMATFTGDGEIQSFTIPHGLGALPRTISTSRNADTGDVFTSFASTFDATNIIINFATPPMNGVSIMINWQAFK